MLQLFSLESELNCLLCPAAPAHLTPPVGSPYSSYTGYRFTDSNVPTSKELVEGRLYCNVSTFKLGLSKEPERHLSLKVSHGRSLSVDLRCQESLSGKWSRVLR